MAIVRVRRPAPPGGGATGHPQVELVQRGGERRVRFPYAPLLTHEGLARRRESRDRSGRKPLLADLGKDLRVITLEALFAYRDHQRSVEGLLRELEQIAEQDKAVKWRHYGPAEDGWYSITSLSISDIQRQEGTNLRTRATVSMTLTEDPDVAVKIGPVSGGHKKAKDKKATKGGGSKGGGWPRTYIVKAGDTLSRIAIRFYDDVGDWKRIAKANNIRDPRKLRVGQKLKIPRPD